MTKEEMDELLEKIENVKNEGELKELTGRGKQHAGRLDTSGLNNTTAEQREKSRRSPMKKMYGNPPVHESIERQRIGYSIDGPVKTRLETIREDAKKKRQEILSKKEAEDYEKLLEDLKSE